MSAWRAAYSVLLHILTPFALARLAWRGRRRSHHASATMNSTPMISSVQRSSDIMP